MSYFSQSDLIRLSILSRKRRGSYSGPIPDRDPGEPRLTPEKKERAREILSRRD